jgi:hypothetical protein
MSLNEGKTNREGECAREKRYAWRFLKKMDMDKIPQTHSPVTKKITTMIACEMGLSSDMCCEKNPNAGYFLVWIQRKDIVLTQGDDSSIDICGNTNPPQSLFGKREKEWQEKKVDEKISL